MIAKTLVVAAVVLALLAVAGRAATSPGRPPAYVIRWAEHWNKVERRQHGSLEVMGLSRCRRDGEAITICVALVHDRASGALGCYRVRVDTSSRLWPPANRTACTANREPVPPSA